MTDLDLIDDTVQYGYELIYEAEMHYASTGHLYKYIMPETHKMRDHGVDRFEEKKGEKLNKDPPTKFLKSFYKGEKSHYV